MSWQPPPAAPPGGAYPPYQAPPPTNPAFSAQGQYPTYPPQPGYNPPAFNPPAYAPQQYAPYPPQYPPQYPPAYQPQPYAQPFTQQAAAYPPPPPVCRDASSLTRMRHSCRFVNSSCLNSRLNTALNIICPSHPPAGGATGDAAGAVARGQDSSGAPGVPRRGHGPQRLCRSARILPGLLRNGPGHLLGALHAAIYAPKSRLFLLDSSRRWQEDACAVFSVVDSDGNGRISEAEFVEYYLANF